MPIFLLFKLMRLWVWLLIYTEILSKWIKEENFKSLIAESQLTPLVITTSSIVILFEVLA